MRAKLGFTLLGLWALSACGDEEKPNTQAGSENAGASAAGCGRGKYPGNTSALKVCWEGATTAKCIPASDVRGYTTYDNDLEVYPGDATAISELACMKSVHLLSISADALTSLAGLESVETVTALQVVGCDKLTSLAGLSSLRNVPQATISGNSSLVDLAGLPKGLTIGSLQIARNPELTTLAGLSDVVVSRKLAVDNNPKLPACEVERFAARFPGIEVSNKGNATTPCP